MLSPPSKMCSPTASRDKTRSPPSSVTAINVKSVVPPPTSQTRMTSPTLTRLRHCSACDGEPGVKGGLGLFEQRDVFESGLRGRLHRQLAGDGVERRRNRQVNLLVLEPIGGRLAGDLRVPGVAEVFEIRGRRADRRDPRHIVGRRPGQDRRAAVDPRMREPALGRADQPPRHLGAVLAGEDADHAVRRRLPRQVKRPGRKLLRTR